MYKVVLKTTNFGAALSVVKFLYLGMIIIAHLTLIRLLSGQKFYVVKMEQKNSIHVLI